MHYNWEQVKQVGVFEKAWLPAEGEEQWHGKWITCY